MVKSLPTGWGSFLWTDECCHRNCAIGATMHSICGTPLIGQTNEIWSQIKTPGKIVLSLMNVHIAEQVCQRLLLVYWLLKIQENDLMLYFCYLFQHCLWRSGKNCHNVSNGPPLSDHYVHAGARPCTWRPWAIQATVFPTLRQSRRLLSNTRFLWWWTTPLVCDGFWFPLNSSKDHFSQTVQYCRWHTITCTEPWFKVVTSAM